MMNNDAWGLVYAHLGKEDIQARKNMVLSSKRFRANPCIASQHLTRFPLYADTTRRDLERSVPLDARITHVVVHELPRDWKLWYHDRLDNVRHLTFKHKERHDRMEGSSARSAAHFARGLQNLEILEVPHAFEDNCLDREDEQWFTQKYGMEEWDEMPNLRELRFYLPDQDGAGWAYTHYTVADGDVMRRVLQRSPQLRTLMLTNLDENESQRREPQYTVFSRLAAPSSLRTLELQMANATDVCHLSRNARSIQDRFPGMRRVILHSLYLQPNEEFAWEEDMQEFERASAAEFVEAGRALAAPLSPVEPSREGGGRFFQVELNEGCLTLIGTGGHVEDFSQGPRFHAHMLRAMRDSTGSASAALSRVRHVRLHKLALSAELAAEIGHTFSGAHTVSLLNLDEGVMWSESAGVSAEPGTNIHHICALLGGMEKIVIASFE